MSETDQRAALRAATVGAKKNFASETFEIGDGVIIEVRQPTVAKRSMIMKAAGLKAGDAETMDMGRLQVMSIICCAYVPGTDKLVFEQADFESILDQPGGSWVDTVGQAAMKLINVKAVEAAKSSGATPNGNSSST